MLGFFFPKLVCSSGCDGPSGSSTSRLEAGQRNAVLWGSLCCWGLPLGSSSLYSWPWSEVPRDDQKSSLQESCNAMNLYPGGDKLVLTAHGQETNNLPSHWPGTWEGS